VDLLTPKRRNPWDAAAGLRIRYHPDTGVYVEGATEPEVGDYDEMRRLMREGDARRRVASHELNERSSRSHACFTIKLFEVYDAGEDVRVPRKWARLNMCDLAGSERQKQTHAAGIRLVESSNINKGLLTLQRVIQALAKEAKPNEVHVVPFRESKLTQLLEESLGGTALCAMIACVSPAENSVGQTALTLRYAASARQIKKVVAQNKAITETAKLKEEVDNLMKQLAEAQDKNKKEAVKQYEEKIMRLEQVLAAEARAREEWESALAEERRRALLNATTPTRIASYLRKLQPSTADRILGLEQKIVAAEAEYSQILQLVGRLEASVQAELENTVPSLPKVDDNSIERLVVQLRTVQAETHKLKQLRGHIVGLYGELAEEASAGASELQATSPELAGIETEAYETEEYTTEEALSQGHESATSAPELAYRGLRELQKYAADGARGVQKRAWEGEGAKPKGFQVEKLMQVVECLEPAQRQVPEGAGSEGPDLQSSLGVGGTQRLNVIDYAVEALDAALESFRREKAEAFEEFLEEHRGLQERAARLAQVAELKEAELQELAEQREELIQSADEANAEVERLQAALSSKASENKKAVGSLRAKNKAMAKEAQSLQADLKASGMECGRLRQELEACAEREREAERRAAELAAQAPSPPPPQCQVSPSPRRHTRGRG